MEVYVKKAIIIAVLVLVVTAFASAGGFDWHFGLGYSATYIGDIGSINTDFTANNWGPFGVGAYVGGGYGFGYSKAIAVGGEFAFTWNTQSTFVTSVISTQIRGYLKWRPGNGGIFTLAGFGGAAFDQYATAGTGFGVSGWSGLVGGRVTILFLFGEYSMIFYDSTQRSTFTFGVAFKK